MPGELAAITFADGSRALALVASIDPVTVVDTFSPSQHLEIRDAVIERSDWSAQPIGTTIQSIARCFLRDPAPPVVIAPAPVAPPVAPAPPEFDADGWWRGAVRRDAHGGRVGGPIHPYATVVHGTASPPEGFAGLIDSWTLSAGSGECAHFVIGRSPAQGVVQLVSISRNGNHAGGPGAGHFAPTGDHPNNVSVGIELHCGGFARLVGGLWRVWAYDATSHSWGPVGDPLAAADVVVDPAAADRGWHVVTDYQYEQLGALLSALERVLAPLPAGCVAVSPSQQPADWAVFPTGRVVAHASLHFRDREDPWPPTCAWMRAWLVAHGWPFAA
ncbi:MAG: N-acetylmuramoyl-L-alanine amidase [Nannocystaceae bacterium]